MTKHHTHLTLAALALATPALAQDLTHKAPPQDHLIAIVNATVHTISGPTIDTGYVVFEHGVITQVGQGGFNLTGPGEVIDATGKHVYPGLIGAVTQTGLTEFGSLGDTVDHNELGQFKPEVRAATAVNPDSAIIPVTRSAGILVTGVFPTSGRVRGRASVVQLDGWTWEDMTVLGDAGLVISWPNARPIRAPWMNRSESEQRDRARKELDELSQFFDQAKAYMEARAIDPTVTTDIRFEAMRSVFADGPQRRPVFIFANDIDQITDAVTWAATYDLGVILVGGRDAPLVAELLKTHGVGVIVSGTHKFPKRNDSNYDDAFTLPKRLQDAGIRWCLASGQGAAHERNLMHNAATAVAFGLSQGDAIRAITLSAAEMLGVAGTLGSIDIGKSATLIIADGTPLEITTSIERAFIDGRDIDLTNKQTKLNDKYREKYRQLGVDNSGN
ncbi:MAG: amidohydrolase family protein [Planctomycetes bacterium]|nr:amidohydrolase family protein [Planctomycetota bacterium]